MNTRNVIWIASYPKSGNTWITSALRAAGTKYGFPEKYDVYEMVRAGEMPMVCPCVREDLRTNPCSVLKTHSVYNPNGQPHKFPGMRLVTAGYAHIYRNPLDVLLSYLNFTRIEYKAHAQSEAYRKALFIDMLGFDDEISSTEWADFSLDAIPQRNLDYALDAFSARGLAIATLEPMAGSWPENTQSWLATDKNVPGFSLRYEDCLKDATQITQLAGLFTFGAAELSAALNHMNRRARQFATSDDAYNSVFYNKLSAYYFREYFSVAAIQRFCLEHETVLRKYGYDEILNNA